MPGRAAVDDDADGAAVRFAEGGDAEKMSEGVRHGDSRLEQGVKARRHINLPVPSDHLPGSESER